MQGSLATGKPRSQRSSGTSLMPLWNSDALRLPFIDVAQCQGISEDGSLATTLCHARGVAEVLQRCPISVLDGALHQLVSQPCLVLATQSSPGITLLGHICGTGIFSVNHERI
jgi:hypothetical protein